MDFLILISFFIKVFMHILMQLINLHLNFMQQTAVHFALYPVLKKLQMLFLSPIKFRIVEAFCVRKIFRKLWLWAAFNSKYVVVLYGNECYLKSQSRVGSR